MKAGKRLFSGFAGGDDLSVARFVLGNGLGPARHVTKDRRGLEPEKRREIADGLSHQRVVVEGQRLRIERAAEEDGEENGSLGRAPREKGRGEKDAEGSEAACAADQRAEPVERMADGVSRETEVHDRDGRPRNLAERTRAFAEVRGEEAFGGVGVRGEDHAVRRPRALGALDDKPRVAPAQFRHGRLEADFAGAFRERRGKILEAPRPGDEFPFRAGAAAAFQRSADEAAMLLFEAPEAGKGVANQEALGVAGEHARDEWPHEFSEGFGPQAAADEVREGFLGIAASRTKRFAAKPNLGAEREQRAGDEGERRRRDRDEAAIPDDKTIRRVGRRVACLGEQTRLLEKRARFRAGDEEGVRSLLAKEAFAANGARGAADAFRSVQNGHPPASSAEDDSGGETRDSRSDDNRGWRRA